MKRPGGGGRMQPQGESLGVIPLLVRRGGCATKKNAKPPLRRRRGGRSQAVFRTHSEIRLVSDHPVRSSKEASRNLLDVASTPPLQGGECPARKTLSKKRKYSLVTQVRAQKAQKRSHKARISCGSCA